jgi:hypothetical protein
LCAARLDRLTIPTASTEATKSAACDAWSRFSGRWACRTPLNIPRVGIARRITTTTRSPALPPRFLASMRRTGRAKDGISTDRAYIERMTKQQSPSQIARAERLRLAAIEGAKARADYEAEGVAARKNMERLRALRLAREAEQSSEPVPTKTQPKKAAKSTKTKAGSLSDWMKAQKNSGRAT